jgi:glutamate racemase
MLNRGEPSKCFEKELKFENGKKDNMKHQDTLQKNDNRPIGVFDSGVGGLTVVKELIKRLPNEDIVYYGDTARVPYGTKSRKTIIKFSIENALFLLKHNVKIIIAACNTSSSVALPALRRKFKVPVIGVIRPGASDSIKVCRNKKIGIIGTAATINSNAYAREISSIDPSVRIFSRICPLLVPIAEEGLTEAKIIHDILKYYLGTLKRENIDTLILGCTHYPILKQQIAGFMGNSVSLVDSAEATSRCAEALLKKLAIASKRHAKGRLKFFVSDEIENFRRIGEKFIGEKLDFIRKAVYGI